MKIELISQEIRALILALKKEKSRFKIKRLKRSYNKLIAYVHKHI